MAMNPRPRALSTFVLLSLLLGAAGCSNLDTMGRKLDMVSERMGTAKPVYEGRLRSAQRVGALYALLFTDGQEFDVADCPATLQPGDIVRLYNTDNGLEAHLWRAGSKDQISEGAEPPANPHRGS
jgi:hypothetical protein